MVGVGYGVYNIIYGGFFFYVIKGWYLCVGQGMFVVMWYVIFLLLWFYFFGFVFVGFWFSMGYGVCWNQIILLILVVLDLLCYILFC